ncbi:dihydroxyacetone kinase subunit DhaK [Actinomadura nitritigenes]|uniref:Dihydroxyacetone kinase subunit DhaK n=1 Tax=Actinomadura nitritigenes TaxID=134602 RepID=A0ABS3RBJ1_9ACTN|nr:dihydroxyacetone kinase subunit DhaK [Actinomadura nitritigenes]MBO2443594.1 dihydroxyacetone kinase subunit DhaK [Actinomadura nitritigenes]
MKKFINSPDTVLTDALAGVAAAHPSLTVDPVGRVITRAARARPGKVALISGGGSGHEPLHGGFVGTGMLDAACPGEVFTSPVPDQMTTAAKAVDSGAGVVFVVKNYTGDVMNFQLAAELAADEGINVATILVDDDVAVQDSTWTAGRRGTGATLLVEKIAGALAEKGGDLAAVSDLGTRVNAASRSFAVALTACTTPAAGKPGFDLPEDEIEVGVGIHGEPGRSREKIRPAAELAATMVEAVWSDMPLPRGAETIVMLNGLGATPLIELYLLFGDVAARLAERGVTIARSLVGNYITSLDMAGASLTVCHADQQMLDLWDSPVDTPALRWGC